MYTALHLLSCLMNPIRKFLAEHSQRNFLHVHVFVFSFFGYSFFVFDWVLALLVNIAFCTVAEAYFTNEQFPLNELRHDNTLKFTYSLAHKLNIANFRVTLTFSQVTESVGGAVQRTDGQRQQSGEEKGVSSLVEVIRVAVY